MFYDNFLFNITDQLFVQIIKILLTIEILAVKCNMTTHVTNINMVCSLATGYDIFVLVENTCYFFKIEIQ